MNEAGVFTTTRGGARAGLAEAVFRGLAPDGGLYVPIGLPSLDWDEVSGRGTDGESDLRPLARRVTPLFFSSLPLVALDRVVEHALDFPVPLVEVERGLFVLELFHGPTHAFKDVGARFMAALMAELDPRPDPSRTVLVATSGDTGGAVASAFHGMDGYRVLVLFPLGAISERQRRQMTTLGGNVHALAVDGTFDDCQRMVKEAFADAAVSDAHRLTSANSINVARLLPQALYYFHAAALLTRDDRSDASPPTFVVPSGNLGNLCAGLIAARAGMPHAGFIAASNANRGFVDFLAGADYEPRGSIRTSSSAMDVGAPSNLERIRWLFGGDDGAVRHAIRGGWADDDVVEERIARTYGETGYVLDPHTAVAFDVAKRHHGDSVGSSVVLATAHPAKFPETVERVIGREIPLPKGLEASRDGSESMRTIAPTLEALREALEVPLER